MKNAKRVFPLEKAEGTAYGDGFRWGSLRIVAGAQVVVGRGRGAHCRYRRGRKSELELRCGLTRLDAWEAISSPLCVVHSSPSAISPDPSWPVRPFRDCLFRRGETEV